MRLYMNIYKYRSNEMLHLTTIAENQIFSALPSNLNDSFEIKFNDKEIRSFVELSESLKKHYGELSQKLEKIGIYSLSKNPLSTTLWPRYANENKGFCIEYDLDLLLSFFTSRTLTYHSNVIYEPTKKLPELTLGDLSNEKIFYEKIMLTKDRESVYEKEYRLIFEKSGLKKIHPEAIKAIYFGEKMAKKSSEINENEISQECIMQKLKGRNIKYFQVHSSDEEYKFYTTEVDDLFKNAEKQVFKKNEIDQSRINHASFKEMNITPETLKKVISILEIYPSKVDSLYARIDEIQGVIIVSTFENDQVIKISADSLKILPTT